MNIKFWIQKKNCRVLRLTATIVAVSFLFTTVSAPFAQASLWEERKAAAKELKKNQENLLAQLPSVDQNIHPIIERHSRESGNLVKLPSLLDSCLSLPPNALIGGRNDDLTRWVSSLPLSYATLKQVSIPPTWKAGDPLLLYIQDAHLNKDAQTNIGKSIQHFIDRGRLDLVALEGAFGTIDLSRFRKFEDQEAIHRVADYLLRENKISGSIHTAFTSANVIPPFLGVDDKAHYDANVEAYRTSYPKIAQYKGEIAKLQEELERKKSQLFTPKLLEFEQKVQAYRDGNAMLGDYIQHLTAYHSGPRLRPSEASSSRNLANRASLLDSGFRRNDNLEIKRFLKALELEQTLDFSQVEKERAALLEKLTQNLNKTQMQELLNVSLAYRLGNVEHSTFYVYLQKLCEQNGIHFKDFPAMDAYLKYVLVSDKINADKLFEETKTLEEKVYQYLAKSKEEKNLIAQSKLLYLTSKLIDCSLTREEWDEYKDHIRRHSGETCPDKSGQVSPE